MRVRVFLFLFFCERVMGAIQSTTSTETTGSDPQFDHRMATTLTPKVLHNNQAEASYTHSIQKSFCLILSSHVNTVVEGATSWRNTGYCIQSLNTGFSCILFCVKHQFLAFGSVDGMTAGCLPEGAFWPRVILTSAKSHTRTNIINFNTLRDKVFRC